MRLNDFRYYLFSIDILKEKSIVSNWGLKLGTYTSLISLAGSKAICKLSDKPIDHLSEIYIFNLFQYRALCTFCETTPDFIKSLIKKNKLSELDREDLSHLNWDYYIKSEVAIPLKPLELASIFSHYFTLDKKKLYYAKSPLFLYVEPKSKQTLNEAGLAEALNFLRVNFNFFNYQYSLFFDCATSSFLNYGPDLENSLVFLSNENLNSESEDNHFHVHMFFLKIMEFTICKRYQEYFKKSFLDYTGEIDKLIQKSQSFNTKLSASKLKSLHEFIFSLLTLRNNFNKTKFQYKNVGNSIQEYNASIKSSTELRLTESIKSRPEYKFELARILVNENDNLLAQNNAIIESINEKIGFQENISLSIFESINALKNIELQKKVYYLTVFVAILTILFFLFSQWNQDTVLYKILKKLNIF